MARKSKKRRPARSTAKDVCFTIMPFGGYSDDYYVSVFSPAITAVGLDPHRADDLFRPSTIVNDIWAYTKKAKLLLADLTGKNPNVFYELGLAHALGKPAILIAETMDDIPFDLRALRIILYDKNASDWGQILKAKIETSLKEVLAAPIEAVLPAFLDTKSAGTKPALSADQKDILEIKQELDLVRRELRNSGSEEKRLRSSIDRLEPNEAMSIINDMVRNDFPDRQIYSRLIGRGPPRQWITDEIKAARDRTLREHRIIRLRSKTRSAGNRKGTARRQRR